MASIHCTSQKKKPASAKWKEWMFCIQFTFTDRSRAS